MQINLNNTATPYLTAACQTSLSPEHSSALVIKKGRQTTAWTLSSRDEPHAVPFARHELCLAVDNGDETVALHLANHDAIVYHNHSAMPFLTLYGVTGDGIREALYDFDLNTEGLQAAAFAVFGIVVGDSTVDVIGWDGSRSRLYNGNVTTASGSMPFLTSLEHDSKSIWAPVLFSHVEKSALRKVSETLCKEMGDNASESWRQRRTWELCQVVSGVIEQHSLLRDDDATDLHWWADRLPINDLDMRVSPAMRLANAVVDLACSKLHTTNLPFAGGTAHQALAALTLVLFALTGRHSSQFELRIGVEVKP